MEKILFFILSFFICTSSVFAESIGGVQLGMTPETVISMYGEPNEVFDKDTYYNYTGNTINGVQVYNNGLAVTYGNGKAIRVAIIRTNDCDRTLDNTGLGLNNSYAEYCDKYSLYRKLDAYTARQYEKMGPKKMATFKTGDKEYMWVNFVNGVIMGLELNNYSF